MLETNRWKQKFNARSGQALLLVTLSLFAMIGMVGFAVDFSYAYFLEKTMQAAADAAAMAAVQRTLEVAGGSASITCANGACSTTYNTPESCSAISSTDTRYAGCRYAVQNGFTNAEVTIDANIAANIPQDVACVAATPPPGVTAPPAPVVRHPPTTGCVDVLYYATAQISRRVPQLFSSILGNTEGGVTSRATGGIARVAFVGALRVINRNDDLSGAPNGTSIPANGTNLEVQGGGTVNVPGGIILGSSSAVSNREAGRIAANSGHVVSPFTFARTGAAIGGSAYQNWTCVTGGAYCAPTTKTDGEMFYDPFDIKAENGDITGQPPMLPPGYTFNATPNTGNLIPVHQGILTTGPSGICPNGNCRPGIYYAVEPDCNGCSTNHPTGDRIRTSNNETVRFQGNTAFETYVFVGGLNFQNGTNATFGAGRYVFAGTINPSNPVFEVPNGVTLTGGNGSDPGRILIFTDFRTDAQRSAPAGSPQPVDVGSYGINGQTQQIMDAIRSACGGCDWTKNPWGNTGLRHGPVDIQSGNNSSSRLVLEGLRPETGSVPADLKNFGRVLMWQDQHNSYLWYNQGARLDLTCGGQNSPCKQTPDDARAPMLSLWASPYTSYDGAIYQPRGAWTKLQGSGSYQGPLLIISGAMLLGGTPTLTLTGLSTPLFTFVPSLLE